jgi:hypothetical protein
MADDILRTPDWWRQRLDYDPETGALTFKERPEEDFPSVRIWKCWNTAHAGKPAFAQKSSHGYLVGRMGGKNFYSHRIIWLMVHGEEPDEIDHINGDGWDNRLSNLRNCTHAENLKNLKRSKANTSGVVGVAQSWGRWRAQIQVGGQMIQAGTFKRKEDAITARKALERLHGFSPTHGTQKMVRR